MEKNYRDLWLSVLYQGKKDSVPQRIEGMVTSQRIVKGETLLVLNVANGVYRSIYIERAHTPSNGGVVGPVGHIDANGQWNKASTSSVESEQDEYALAVEKFENMAEYTPYDNDWKKRKKKNE